MKMFPIFYWFVDNLAHLSSLWIKTVIENGLTADTIFEYFFAKILTDLQSRYDV